MILVLYLKTTGEIGMNGALAQRLALVPEAEIDSICVPMKEILLSKPVPTKVIGSYGHHGAHVRNLVPVELKHDPDNINAQMKYRVRTKIVEVWEYGVTGTAGPLVLSLAVGVLQLALELIHVLTPFPVMMAVTFQVLQFRQKLKAVVPTFAVITANGTYGVLVPTLADTVCELE